MKTVSSTTQPLAERIAVESDMKLFNKNDVPLAIAAVVAVALAILLVSVNTA